MCGRAHSEQRADALRHRGRYKRARRPLSQLSIGTQDRRNITRSDPLGLHRSCGLWMINFGLRGYPTAANTPMFRFIEIEQVRSPKKLHGSQQGILEGLGLGRIGRISWVSDTSSHRGMIRKVSHLVQINNDPSTPKRRHMAAPRDEAADIALIRKLAFDGKGIALEPYSNVALKKGKCPDFKLFKDGGLVGFCEVKSPRDDYVFEAPAKGEFAVRENLPFYRKIGSHIKRAASQFDAVNLDHGHPNILAFVSHTPDIARRDLHATVAGLPGPTPGERVFMLGRRMQEQVLDAARKVDLFLWIDAENRTCQHVSVNGAPHQADALNLLGLKNEGDAE
jgi:ribosomal protein L30